MSENIIIYPTSANPPTRGHADLIHRASQKFDKIYWLAAINPEKKSYFPIKAKLEMMQEYIDYFRWNNVIARECKGSVMRYAMKKGAKFILRGVRNYRDFYNEVELANGNQSICMKIETICMIAKPEYTAISSYVVRTLLRLGEEVDKYILPSVAEKSQQYISLESK